MDEAGSYRSQRGGSREVSEAAGRYDMLIVGSSPIIEQYFLSTKVKFYEKVIFVFNFWR